MFRRSTFKRVTHLFRKFEVFLENKTCFDEEIKRQLKLRNFKKVFQITKIVKFEIHFKKYEIEIFYVVELFIA